MASHPSPPRQEQCAPPPNWLELPADVSTSILRRLSAVEILTSAQQVCSTWRRICRDPSMWRSIDLRGYGIHCNSWLVYCKLYRHAVDRSSGGLLDVNLDYLASDDLLRYITDRSKHLRRLRLDNCSLISDLGLVEAAGKIPFLEELDISYCHISSKAVAAVGRLCPLLESFKLNAHVYKRSYLESDLESDNEAFAMSYSESDNKQFFIAKSDFEAFAIAKNMPGLHHLQIFGNKLRNAGLVAILDGCQHLKSLDLRQCFHVNLDADLRRRCSERIKDFWGPNDSSNDYPCDSKIYGDVEEMFSGGSDDESDVEEMFSGGSDDESDVEEMFSGGSDDEPDVEEMYDPDDDL